MITYEEVREIIKNDLIAKAEGRYNSTIETYGENLKDPYQPTAIDAHKEEFTPSGIIEFKEKLDLADNQKIKDFWEKANEEFAFCTSSENVIPAPTDDSLSEDQSLVLAIKSAYSAIFTGQGQTRALLKGEKFLDDSGNEVMLFDQQKQHIREFMRCWYNFRLFQEMRMSFSYHFETDFTEESLQKFYDILKSRSNATYITVEKALKQFDGGYGEATTYTHSKWSSLVNIVYPMLPEYFNSLVKNDRDYRKSRSAFKLKRILEGKEIIDGVGNGTEAATLDQIADAIIAKFKMNWTDSYGSYESLTETIEDENRPVEVAKNLLKEEDSGAINLYLVDSEGANMRNRFLSPRITFSDPYLTGRPPAAYVPYFKYSLSDAAVKAILSFVFKISISEDGKDTKKKPGKFGKFLRNVGGDIMQNLPFTTSFSGGDKSSPVNSPSGPLSNTGPNSDASASVNSSQVELTEQLEYAKGAETGSVNPQSIDVQESKSQGTVAASAEYPESQDSDVTVDQKNIQISDATISSINSGDVTGAVTSSLVNQGSVINNSENISNNLGGTQSESYLSNIQNINPTSVTNTSFNIAGENTASSETSMEKTTLLSSSDVIKDTRESDSYKESISKGDVMGMLEYSTPATNVSAGNSTVSDVKTSINNVSSNPTVSTSVNNENKMIQNLMESLQNINSSSQSSSTVTGSDMSSNVTSNTLPERTIVDNTSSPDTDKETTAAAGNTTIVDNSDVNRNLRRILHVLASGIDVKIT